MKLIQFDPSATDILYHNIQKERKYEDAPLLALHRLEELYKISRDLLAPISQRKSSMTLLLAIAKCISQLHYDNG